MFENENAFAETPKHKTALDYLSAGIRAAHPKSVIETTVSLNGNALTINEVEYNLGEHDRIIALGGGNAAGQIAAALEETFSGRIDSGIVVTDDPVSLSTIECIEGSHPIPNTTAADGTQRMLELVSNATKDDLIIAIITGSGSALLPALAGFLELTNIQTVTDRLLTSSATISEINAVRKHLSDIKGGKTCSGNIVSDDDRSSVQ